MLQAKDISYSIGDRQILNSVSFSLMPGDKVAVVGVNGAGKSTLVKIIAGELSPDEGEIVRPKRIGYVPQIITEEIIVQQGCTVQEFMFEGRGLNKIDCQLRELAQKMGQKLGESEADQVLSSYSHAQDEFARLGGYEAEAEIETVLHGIGLNIGLERVVSSLSGGEKTKLAFARSLFADCELLVLDEPTNHIDWQYYAWLGKYLQGANKTVLVVSHHPDFINPFTRKILEIERFTGRLREYCGTYDEYLEKSALNEMSLMRQVEWMDKEIARLKQSALRLQYGGPNKASAAQNMFGRIVRLEKQRAEIVEESPRHERSIRLKFTILKRPGEIVVRAQNISKSFGGRKIFEAVSFDVHRDERVVIIGPNGSGKTTIIRMLMGSVRPDTGEIGFGFNVVPGYYAQEHENLRQELSVIEEVQDVCCENRGNLRSVLGRFLFSQEKAFQKIATLSQGEKNRLSLCKIIVGGCNLLVMDEPTNYLDPASRDAVCGALSDFEGTVLVVSHDLAFIRKIVPGRVIVMPGGESKLFSESLLND